MNKIRICKQCSAEILEEQAQRTYAEYDLALCEACERALAQKNAVTPPPPPSFSIYEMSPDGPIYQAPELAKLPPDAVFVGYYRPRKGGCCYQLFKMPAGGAPEDPDQETRKALQDHGFIF